ncbi:MAG TPA: ATP-binding protein [Bacteroidota bacterium]|nr:ATP-binding protein [Bacteroidota bacterium]
MNSHSNTLIDYLYDAVVIADAEQVIRQWNRAAALLYGWTPEEVIGRTMTDIFKLSSFVDKRTREAISIRLRQNGYWEGEINQPDRDGNLLYVDARVFTQRTQPGDEIEIVAIFRDTTRRRMDERILSEYQQKINENNELLEKVNKRKDEFLATTSHELRTPLNGIVGFLTLVEQGLARDEDEAKRFVGQALASSKHLLSLINDLLDISKIESGKMTLQTESISIDQMWTEVRSLLEVQAQNKNIYLQYTGPQRRDAAVMADRARLMQVLLNLVANAIKFTNQGGVTLTIEEHYDKGYVEFKIVDTGIGIAKNMQHKLFKKFSQVDGSYTRQSGGTGLGLSIAKNLVEKMGGVISLESEGIEKGTRVMFRLPVAVRIVDSLIEPAPGHQSDNALKDTRCILIVEDDLMYAALIRDVLDEAGSFSIRAVTTADDALSELLQFKPSVVLSDYALPSRAGASLLNGIDLLKKIRSIPAVAHTPVVMMSGHEDICREIEQMESDRMLTRTLIKPLNIKELLHAVTALARQS